MGSRMSPLPPPPAIGPAPVTPEERTRSTLPGQLGWTTAGLVSLFLLVLIAHATEVAFDCTLYGIYESDGTAGACPLLSWPTLVILASFGIPSSAVALGLSGSLVSMLSPVRAQPDQRTVNVDPRRLAIEFTAPFLSFFGWGVLAWGLTEPILENCIEPCGYPTFPYVLEGTAFLLSVIGGIALIIGGGLMARLWQVQRQQRPAVG
jgi:hypothetical protein